MSLQEKYSSRSQVSASRGSGTLIRLIVALIAIFITFSFVKVGYFFNRLTLVDFYNGVMQWFVLPANPGTLITRPWTLFTYPFMEIHTWVMISNLLWLWGFGYILQEMAGQRKLFPLFLYGIVTGGLLYFGACNLIPILGKNGYIMGASAGVMAVAVAATTLAPGYRIFPFINGGIPLWIMLAIYLVVDLAGINIQNPAGHIAHLGGALAGFTVMMVMRKTGRDWCQPLNRFFDRVVDLTGPNKKRPKKSFRDELFYDTAGREPYKKIHGLTQQRIDEILDKINQKGYQFLSEEEKELLRRAGEEEL